MMHGSHVTYSVHSGKRASSTRPLQAVRMRSMASNSACRVGFLVAFVWLLPLAMTHPSRTKTQLRVFHGGQRHALVRSSPGFVFTSTSPHRHFPLGQCFLRFFQCFFHERHVLRIPSFAHAMPVVRGCWCGRRWHRRRHRADRHPSPSNRLLSNHPSKGNVVQSKPFRFPFDPRNVPNQTSERT